MNWDYKKGLTFLTFVIVAGVMWFVFKYNEVYSQHVAINVEWNNIPDSFEVTGDEPVSIDVELTASGFTLLRALYFPPSIQLDFQNYVIKEDGLYYYLPGQSITAIKSQLSKNYKVEYVTDQKVSLDVIKYQNKKVALKGNFDLVFKENLQLREQPFFSKDSVFITGNDQIVQTITDLKISSEELVIADTLNRYTFDLGVLFPDLKIEPSIVEYQVQAAVMTEGSFQVPVKINNVPPGVVVKIIPSSVEVVFNCKLNDFQEIESNDFEVVVEYLSLEEDYNTVVPELLYDSKMISTARFIPQQIKVLQVR